ncbi:MAG TPA: hypothetical protein PK523_00040 [Elusimicrobiales bacterium]|nr:hypothetical protein [Elusimicrobiales bacterium]
MAFHQFLVGTEFPDVAFFSILGMVATLVLFAVDDYRCFSPVAMFSLMAMVSYPIAAYLNLTLDCPIVRADLWAQAPKALAGYVAGVLASAAGVKVWRFLHLGKETGHSPKRWITTRSFNFTLVSIVFVVLILRLKLGVYFHSSIASFNFENAAYLNLCEHLIWLAYCGIFLQVYRYTVTHSRNDLGLSVIFMSLPVLLFLPSGSRMRAFGYLPILGMFYLHYERRFRLQVIAVIGVLLVSSFLVVAFDSYRGIKGLVDARPEERYLAFRSAIEQAREDRHSSIKVLVWRLSDFASTGAIVALTPERFQFRLFEGMSSWWQIFVPGVLRPKDSDFNFGEGANAALDYGISTSESSSSPVMLIGDIYRRFGWSGVLLCMFIAGYLLKSFESRILKENGLFVVVFTVLFYRFLFLLYAGSLLSAFTAVARDVFLIYFISKGICLLAKRTGSVEPASLYR